MDRSAEWQETVDEEGQDVLYLLSELHRAEKALEQRHARLEEEQKQLAIDKVALEKTYEHFRNKFDRYCKTKELVKETKAHAAAGPLLSSESSVKLMLEEVQRERQALKKETAAFNAMQIHDDGLKAYYAAVAGHPLAKTAAQDLATADVMRGLIPAQPGQPAAPATSVTAPVVLPRPGHLPAFDPGYSVPPIATKGPALSVDAAALPPFDAATRQADSAPVATIPVPPSASDYGHSMEDESMPPSDPPVDHDDVPMDPVAIKQEEAEGPTDEEMATRFVDQGQLVSSVNTDSLVDRTMGTVARRRNRSMPYPPRHEGQTAKPRRSLRTPWHLKDYRLE